MSHGRIEIFTKQSNLSRERWVFVLIDDNLILDAVRHETRASGRHKFQARNEYQRLFERSSTLPEPTEIPSHIADEAKEQLLKRITVMTQSQWRTD